jgi:hypothetical protein
MCPGPFKLDVKLYFKYAPKYVTETTLGFPFWLMSLYLYRRFYSREHDDDNDCYYTRQYWSGNVLCNKWGVVGLTQYKLMSSSCEHSRTLEQNTSRQNHLLHDKPQKK